MKKTIVFLTFAAILVISCAKKPAKQEMVQFSSLEVEVSFEKQSRILNANRKFYISELYNIDENGNRSIGDKIPVSEIFSRSELELTNGWLHAATVVIEGEYCLKLDFEENNSGKRRICEVLVDYPISGRRIHITQNSR